MHNIVGLLPLAKNALHSPTSFNQASVVIIFQCIVNATCTPVSTQSSDNMGKKLSQNREKWVKAALGILRTLKSVHVHFDLRKLQITSAMNIARERS